MDDLRDEEAPNWGRWVGKHSEKLLADWEGPSLRNSWTLDDAAEDQRLHGVQRWRLRISEGVQCSCCRLNLRTPQCPHSFVEASCVQIQYRRVIFGRFSRRESRKATDWWWKVSSAENSSAARRKPEGPLQTTRRSVMHFQHMLAATYMTCKARWAMVSGGRQDLCDAGLDGTHRSKQMVVHFSRLGHGDGGLSSSGGKDQRQQRAAHQRES